MNNRFGKLKSNLKRKSKAGVVVSIVILIEVLAILTVATYAWVETVSSIKIKTEANAPLEVDTYVFTEAMIGSEHGTIDLAKYFKQAGDMHLAPCSSADGVNLYFPKVTAAATGYSTGANSFRKGNSSDKNTAYMSITFKLRADTNADFFFTQAPTLSNDIRVSVTAYTEGTSEGDLYDNNGKPKYTKIYGNSASTTAVVSGTASSVTANPNVEAFSSHIKGTGTANRLFAVGANETKIVTINVWLQGSSMSSSLPANLTLSNLGITSSLTPRHVTLLPTPTWEENSPTYYAWCWDATNGDPSKLFKLDLDADEHYSFDYNGTYQKTTFVRAVPGCTVSAVDEKGNNGKAYSAWPFSNNSASNTDGYWNQTVNTSIPNDPVDPTYIIETISGGTDSKSTGSWHDPATIKVATKEGQSTWGNVSATSYIGANDSTHVIEATNSSSTKHKDTVHAWPSKAIKLTASVTSSSNYAFVGWYNNPDCTGNALSTNATFTTTAPSTASEVTYYAKFKEISKITLSKVLDNNDSSSTSVGTLYVDTHPSGSGTVVSSTGGSATKTFDKGATAKIWATAKTGYTLDGIYSTKTGTTPPSTTTVTESGITKYVIEADTTKTYYARYTSNKHTVYIDATGSSGSTVQYGNETASTSVTKTNVKYNTSVTIKANPATGYRFVGWYTNSTCTTAASGSYTNASYTFTLGDSDVHYYAKFEAKNSYYLTASWNSWSQTQDHLTGSGNELTFTQELDPGEYTFKIYDGADALHWSNAYTYKYKYSSSTDTYLGASGGDTLNSSNNTGNMLLNVGVTAKFTFHFNRTTNKFWLTAEDVVTYHVVGDITGGWSIGNNNKMTRVGTSNEYTYSVYVNGSKEFKILTSSGTWYSNGYGYHNSYYGASGGDTFNSSSGNCTMNGNKTYIFHFNSSTKKFWITDP